MKRKIGLALVVGASCLAVGFGTASHSTGQAQPGTFNLPAKASQQIVRPTECLNAQKYRITVDRNAAGPVEVWAKDPKHPTAGIHPGGSLDIESGNFELTLIAGDKPTSGRFEVVPKTP